MFVCSRQAASCTRTFRGGGIFDLLEVVSACRADEGETVIDSAGFVKTYSTNEEKIAALAELICRADDEAGTKSAALLVLMSTLENAPHPKALANLAKHFAFTRCGVLNLSIAWSRIDCSTRERAVSRPHAVLILSVAGSHYPATLGLGLDTVSTIRGSGWVKTPDQNQANGMLINPSATADGTDLF